MDRARCRLCGSRCSRSCFRTHQGLYGCHTRGCAMHHPLATVDRDNYFCMRSESGSHSRSQNHGGGRSRRASVSRNLDEEFINTFANARIDSSSSDSDDHTRRPQPSRSSRTDRPTSHRRSRPEFDPSHVGLGFGSRLRSFFGMTRPDSDRSRPSTRPVDSRRTRRQRYAQRAAASKSETSSSSSSDEPTTRRRPASQPEQHFQSFPRPRRNSSTRAQNPPRADPFFGFSRTQSQPEQHRPSSSRSRRTSFSGDFFGFSRPEPQPQRQSSSSRFRRNSFAGEQSYPQPQPQPQSQSQQYPGSSHSRRNSFSGAGASAFFGFSRPQYPPHAGPSYYPPRAGPQYPPHAGTYYSYGMPQAQPGYDPRYASSRPGSSRRQSQSQAPKEPFRYEYMGTEEPETDTDKKKGKK